MVIVKTIRFIWTLKHWYIFLVSTVTWVGGGWWLGVSDESVVGRWVGGRFTHKSCTCNVPAGAAWIVPLLVVRA